MVAITAKRLQELAISQQIAARLNAGESTSSLYSETSKLDGLSSAYGIWYHWCPRPGYHVNTFDFVLDGEIKQ